MKSTHVKLTGGVLLLLLAGCIVQSVHPFYTPADLISDPGLAGRWIKTNASSTNEFWNFTALGGQACLLGVTDDTSTNGFEGHLFQLKETQFIDLYSTNREEFQLPMHLISKYSRDETNLTLQFLDYGWLAGLLETNPAVLAHIFVPEKPGDTNSGMLYLTATTPDLQAFLRRYTEDTNAFCANSTVLLRRVSP